MLTTMYKFRAQYTDGSRGFMRDHRGRALHCGDRTDAARIAKTLARQNNVQAVAVISIPIVGR